MIARRAAAFLLLLISVLAAACDQLPLLAPSASTITLTAGTATLSANGTTELRATVLEASGTPVHNGTLVTFSTTVGRLDPPEARTHNGTTTVRLSGNGQSGIAKITASSGGAKTAELDIKVGAAASKTVTVAANPAMLASTGGASDIIAFVVDEAGAAVVGAPVTFSTTAGTISPATAVTDSSGVAQARLVTSLRADVTATSGTASGKVTVDLRPRVGVTIQGPSTPPAAGLPATFTVGVASGANVTDVIVDFGDGSQLALGALSGSTTISHTYQNAGTFTATATAIEVTGERSTVSTAITILPAQPPGVIIQVSDQSPAPGQIITLTATVSGATSTVLRYEWDFGDGTTAITTGNQITKSWAVQNTYVVRVTVVQASGPSGQGQTVVDVKP